MKITMSSHSFYMPPLMDFSPIQKYVVNASREHYLNSKT